MVDRVRRQVRVTGVVQGVGFRPFVYSLATGLGLAGLVGNDLDGVFVEIEGVTVDVAEFLRELESNPPPLAALERVTVTETAPSGSVGFTIVDSDGTGSRRTLVAPDSATCADCLRELADPADRRFGYPFINCTNCGPRFTIVRDVPYDRPSTTMADFPMCAACAAEYHDPADRRFHAQPTCCLTCGPRLRLLDPAGTEQLGDPITETAALLRAGQVIAIKGLGGYHLAVLAGHEPAAATLRPANTARTSRSPSWCPIWTLSARCAGWIPPVRDSWPSSSPASCSATAVPPSSARSSVSTGRWPASVRSSRSSCSG